MSFMLRKIFLVASIFLSMQSISFANINHYESCGKDNVGTYRPDLGGIILIHDFKRCVVAALNNVADNIIWQPEPAGGWNNFVSHQCYVKYNKDNKAWVPDFCNGSVEETDKIASIDNTFAARACQQSLQGGFDDWYLPGLYELHSMYKLKDALGVRKKEHFWSSSEFNTWGIVWGEDLSIGYPYIIAKDGYDIGPHLANVRCVRSIEN